jgi:hypothetical protein
MIDTMQKVTKYGGPFLKIAGLGYKYRYYILGGIIAYLVYCYK